MRKLTDYVEMAAAEYLQETGKEVLDSLWLAEFFQDGGVMDDFPNQDLVGFFALVQKALTIRIEKAEKLARLQQEKSSRASKQ
jgi:predicted NUDIX family NTP pyrophosphohydrolase